MTLKKLLILGFFLSFPTANGQGMPPPSASLGPTLGPSFDQLLGSVTPMAGQLQADKNWRARWGKNLDDYENGARARLTVIQAVRREQLAEIDRSIGLRQAIGAFTTKCLSGPLVIDELNTCWTSGNELLVQTSALVARLRSSLASAEDPKFKSDLNEAIASITGARAKLSSRLPEILSARAKIREREFQMAKKTKKDAARQQAFCNNFKSQMDKTESDLTTALQLPASGKRAYQTIQGIADFAELEGLHTELNATCALISVDLAPLRKNADTLSTFIDAGLVAVWARDACTKFERDLRGELNCRALSLDRATLYTLSQLEQQAPK